MANNKTLSSSLITYYDTKLIKDLDTIPDYVEVRPRSKLKRLAIKLHLKPKQYRAKAKKGYVLRKDVFGKTIQVPKELALKDKTLKNYGKTINFTIYTPQEVDQNG